MALGADRRNVVVLVVRQAALMVVVGIVVGVGAATLFSQVMTSLLYGVHPSDAQTYALAAVGLSLAALSAALIPALHAGRIDPAETLR
jgi:ABC-type antimicrobial peptide transport system permease subunit